MGYILTHMDTYIHWCMHTYIHAHLHMLWCTCTRWRERARNKIFLSFFRNATNRLWGIQSKKCIFALRRAWMRTFEIFFHEYLYFLPDTCLYTPLYGWMCTYVPAYLHT
jgi:hypothetical protein